MKDVKTVGIIGFGVMGAAIGLNAAANGYRVVYKELNDDLVKSMYDKFVVKGEVHTMADESYTSHNTERLDVEGTVKKILTTEYVQNALKGIPNV